MEQDRDAKQLNGSGLTVVMGCCELWLYYKLHILRHLGSTLSSLWSRWSSGECTLRGLTKHEQHLNAHPQRKVSERRRNFEARSTISKNKPQFAHTQSWHAEGKFLKCFGFISQIHLENITLKMYGKGTPFKIARSMNGLKSHPQ